VLAAVKDSGDYDDTFIDRLRTVLLAPHKHKGREAHKTKQTGSNTTSSSSSSTVLV